MQKYGIRIVFVFSFSLHSVLHISFHYFGFTFSFLFHTYIVFRCMFPLCFTKDARLLYHFIIRISFSFLIFCMLFFFAVFFVCFCFNRHALWHLHRYTHTFINRYICKSVCILMHLCVCVFHVVFSTRTLNISYNAVKKNTLLKILKIIEGNFMSDFALELSHILSYIDYAYLLTSFHFLSFFLSFRYVYVCVCVSGCVFVCVSVGGSANVSNRALMF